ncbi:unnamed protein product [Phyllotreta striolata]|uniref:C2H2-type domain-containing protein n=1 Tax=Phyllotreta striolata TaxID=444603 RepID=A0A9N9TQY5_PHYSR|nr:unnamed protein product [Phyllotreta striolata]
MKKTTKISLESTKPTKRTKNNNTKQANSKSKNVSTNKINHNLIKNKPPVFNMNQPKKEQPKEIVTTVVNPVRNLFEKIKLRMDRQHDSSSSLFAPPASLQTDEQKPSDNEVIVINEQIPEDVVVIDDADTNVQLDANLSNNNEEKPKTLERQCSACKQTDNQTECTHLGIKLVQKQPECSHSECKPTDKQPECFCSTIKKTECLSCDTECNHLVSDKQTKCSHSLNKPTDKPRKRRNNLPTIPLDLFNSSMLLRSELKTPQPKTTPEPVVRKIDNKPEKCCNKPKKSASTSSENLVYEVVKQNSTEQAEANTYTDENNDVVIVESANQKVEPLIIKLKVSQNNKPESLTLKKFIDKTSHENSNKPLKDGENLNLNALEEPLVVEQTENTTEQSPRQLRSNRTRKPGQLTEEVGDENKSSIDESESPKTHFTECLIKESSKKAKFQARYENLSIDLLDYANMTIDTTTPRRLRSVRLQNTPNTGCNSTNDSKEDPDNCTEGLSNLDKTIESVVNWKENSQTSANKNMRKRVSQKKAIAKIGNVFKKQSKPKKSTDKKSTQNVRKNGKAKKLPAKSDLQQPRSLRSKSKSFKPPSIEVKKELIEGQPVTRVEQKVIAIVHHEPKPKSTHSTETAITEEIKRTRQRKLISENLNEIKQVKEKPKPKNPQKGRPVKKPSEHTTDKPLNKPKFVKHTKLIQRIVEELKNTILNRSKSGKKLSVAIKNKLQLKVARRKLMRRKAELKRQLRSRESDKVKEETTVHLVDGCLEEIAGKKQTDSIVIINDVTVNKTVEDTNEFNGKKSDITVFDFQDTEPDETPLRLKFTQPMKEQMKTPFDDEFVETSSRSPIKNEQTQSILQSNLGDNQPKKLWSIIETPKTPRPPKPSLQFINMASQYLKDDDSHEPPSVDRDSQPVQEKKSPLKQPTIIEMFSKAWKKRDVKQDIFSNIPPKTEPANNQNNPPSPQAQKDPRSPRRDPEEHEHDELDKDSDTESRMEWVPEEYAEYKMKYSMQYSRKLLKSNKPTFKCKVCQMPQPTYYKLLKHRRLHEGQDRPHVCPHCGSEFREVEDFSAHLRVHKGKHPYMCNKCDSGFWTKKAYQAHAAVHVLKKPKPLAKKFRCDVCAKEFAKLCDVERHARVHTGEKSSVCNICNKGFVQAHNLSKHLLTHLHVKPFVCEICDKKFGRNDVLRRHLLTHSVRKPVGCEICGRGFIRRTQLVQHVRKKHPERLGDFETA